MRFGGPALAVAVALAAASPAGCTSGTSGHGQVATACRPVFFGVAGSGQGVQNPPPEVIPDAVSRADADSYGTTIGLLKTELAGLAGPQLASAAAIDYPAIPVNKYIGHDGLVGDLAISEGQGVHTLLSSIRTVLADCPTRTVLLAGYSQGAEVVTLAVKALPPGQQAHVAVALFGNPSYLPGKPGDYPGDTRARGVRPALKRGAYQLPADVRSRTIDICAPLDGVCNVDPQRSTSVGKLSYVLTHTKAHINDYAFGVEGYAERAASFLWAHR